MLSTLVRGALPGVIAVRLGARRKVAAGNAEAAKERARVRSVFTMKNFQLICGYGGIGLASLVGSYQARCAGMTVVGCSLLGFANGVGGGTLRDVLLGRRVFWLRSPEYAWWCLGAALSGTLLCESVKERAGLFDNVSAKLVSLGSLGNCCCMGGEIGIKHGSGKFGQPLRGALYAMLCSSGGSLTKDYLLGRRPAILYPEGFAHIIPAAFGALWYQAAHKLGIPYPGIVSAAYASSISLRLYLTKRYAEKMKSSKL